MDALAMHDPDAACRHRAAAVGKGVIACGLVAVLGRARAVGAGIPAENENESSLEV